MRHVISRPRQGYPCIRGEDVLAHLIWSPLSIDLDDEHPVHVALLLVRVAAHRRGIMQTNLGQVLLCDNKGNVSCRIGSILVDQA